MYPPSSKPSAWLSSSTTTATTASAPADLPPPDILSETGQTTALPSPKATRDLPAAEAVPTRAPRGCSPAQPGVASCSVGGESARHGLDVTEALGPPRPPADRVRTVSASAGPRTPAYFDTDLTEVRLVATDTGLSLGDGPEVVEVPATDLSCG